MDIFNYLKGTASQCGLPASTVNLTVPNAGGGDGWPWPRAAAAENFVSQGEKTICSPGNALTLCLGGVSVKRRFHASS
jgi:hypothetical protein